jgi:glycosyltransferase involved in cell wall biosynthesis
MKILHLISSTGLFGAERVVLELSQSLKKIGHTPIVGAIENTYNPNVQIVREAKKLGLDTIIFPCESKFDQTTIRNISYFLRQKGIHLVHTHGYKSNFFGLLSSDKKTRLISTNHNWLTSSTKLKFFRFFDALCLRRFHRIVAVSTQVKHEMLKLRLSPNKITVIHNGIALERFETQKDILQIKKRLKIDPKAKIIGTIGSLTPEKNHEQILRATEILMKVRAPIQSLIVGTGPLKTHLEQVINHRKIANNVILAGYRTDIPELLSIMDIFLLPSYTEGLPMVILEALASKKPVIASEVGGVPEIIRHNISGYLITPGDVFTLTSRISELLNNPREANRLAANGHNIVKRQFSSETMARRYLAAYIQ